MKRCAMCGNEATGRMTMQLLTPPGHPVRITDEGVKPPGPAEFERLRRDGEHHFAICEANHWCRDNFMALPYDRRVLILLAAEAGVYDAYGHLLYHGFEQLLSYALRQVRKMAAELRASEGERTL